MSSCSLTANSILELEILTTDTFLNSLYAMTALIDVEVRLICAVMTSPVLLLTIEEQP
jgi:hypothetical protein